MGGLGKWVDVGGWERGQRYAAVSVWVGGQRNLHHAGVTADPDSFTLAHSRWSRRPHTRPRRPRSLNADLKRQADSSLSKANRATQVGGRVPGGC